MVAALPATAPASTAAGSDEQCGCCLTVEDEKEDEELTALRRGMARLKTSLGQVRGDADTAIRHHAIATFPMLERGLEVLERARKI